MGAVPGTRPGQTCHRDEVILRNAETGHSANDSSWVLRKHDRLVLVFEETHF